MPDVQRPHGFEARHVCLVTLDGLHDRHSPLPGRQAVLPSCDIDAGSQALKVPFPGADQRLIKIVEIKDQLTMR
jgi:hypothetical protein